MLSISSARYDTKACIDLGSDGRVESSETLKVLGFTFSNKPTVEAQINTLIRKANKRFFVLLRHKRAGIPKPKLKDLYTSVQRSVLEYSSVVFHSQFNKHQTNLLQKVQKKTLRAIYGYELTYQQLLEKSQLPSLEERRTEALAKFAKKTSENPKYANTWFPQRNIRQHTRANNPFTEEIATGCRLYKSPVFAMRRLLNEGEEDNTADLTGLFSDPY